MKILTIVLRILLILVLLLPIAGALGLLPPPTPDLYTPGGWAFMLALMNTGYMMYLIALTALICVVLLVLGKTALTAVILAPFTVNVIAFHWFLDAGPFHPSVTLAYILLVCNVYFLWQNWGKYRTLWA